MGKGEGDAGGGEVESESVAAFARYDTHFVASEMEFLPALIVTSSSFQIKACGIQDKYRVINHARQAAAATKCPRRAALTS